MLTPNYSYIGCLFTVLLLSAEHVCCEPDVAPLPCPTDLVVGVNKTTFLRFGGTLIQHTGLTLTSDLLESPLNVIHESILNRDYGYEFSEERRLNIKISRTDYKHAGEYKLYGKNKEYEDENNEEDLVEDDINEKLDDDDNEDDDNEESEDENNQELKDDDNVEFDNDEPTPICSTHVQVLGNPFCAIHKVERNNLAELCCSLNYSGYIRPKLSWNGTICQNNSRTRPYSDRMNSSVVCCIDSSLLLSGFTHLPYVTCEVLFEKDLMMQDESGNQSTLSAFSAYSSCRISTDTHEATLASSSTTSSTPTSHVETTRACDQQREIIRKVVENTTTMQTYMESRIMRKVENITIVMQTQINELKTMVAESESRMYDKVLILLETVEYEKFYLGALMLVFLIINAIVTSAILAVSKCFHCCNDPSRAGSMNHSYRAIPLAEELAEQLPSPTNNNNQRLELPECSETEL